MEDVLAGHLILGRRRNFRPDTLSLKSTLG